MALRDDLIQGLKNADAAGDTAAAAHFADQLNRLAEPITPYSVAAIKEGSKPAGRQLAADRVLEAGQGAGLGWADETAGLVGGIDSLLRGKNSKTGQDTFSGGYNATVGQARRDLADYEADRPVEALGLNVLGSLPAAALAGPEAFAGKATLGQKMLQAAKTGAKVGAVAGAGYGDNNRITGAAGGALTGGALSAAVPLIPAAVRGVKSIYTKFTNPADRFAHTAIANALTGDQVSTLSPDRPLIDQVPVGGTTTGLAEQAALEGQGQKQANDFFRSDARAREGTVLNTVKGVVNDTPMYDMMDDLSAQRKADATPLYTKAYNSPYRRTPKLMNLLDRPATGGALRAALTRISNDPNLDPEEVRATLGTILGDNAENLSDAQLQQRFVQAMGTRPVEFRALDYVKRGLDAMVLDNPKAAWEVRQLRNAYAAELKNINPNYQAALNAYSGPSAILDAIAQGREFDSSDPEAISRTLSQMSDSEQQGYQVGVARRLQDLASGAGSRQPGQTASLNLAKGIEGNSVMQRRLTAALGTNGQNAPQLLQRNGWRPIGDGVFENATKPGMQITVNTDGTWSAGRLSKSGKSSTMINSGPDTSSLEGFVGAKPIVQKPGATSVQDLIDMATQLKERAEKGAQIVGNSATARRLVGQDTFDDLGDAAQTISTVMSGPHGWSLAAARAAMGRYMAGLTSARRAQISKLLYSKDPQDNLAAIDAIEKIRAGQVPTAMQQRLTQGSKAIPVVIGSQAGQGVNGGNN